MKDDSVYLNHIVTCIARIQENTSQGYEHLGAFLVFTPTYIWCQERLFLLKSHLTRPPSGRYGRRGRISVVDIDFVSSLDRRIPQRHILPCLFPSEIILFFYNMWNLCFPIVIQAH